MFEYLFGGLIFAAIMACGGSLLTFLATRNQPLRERLQMNERGGLKREGTHELIGSLGRIGRAVLPRGGSANLSEQLAQAGYYGKAAPAVFIGCKLLFFAIALVTAVFLILPTEIVFHLKLLFIIVISGLAFFIPNYFLLFAKRRQQREVRRHLADVVDLLEICVCSGMGLDMAWNLISDEIRRVSFVMSDQMVLTNLEVHLGGSRVQALRNMAKRSNSQDVLSFSTLLAQSERFGTSIADVLRIFAKSMREERTMRAQETAEKTAVKLLFPMILFIFPALLVVMAGPAVIRIIDVVARQ